MYYSRFKNRVLVFSTCLLTGFLPIISYGEEHKPLPILISTDVANGLIDTHGAQGSLPVAYNSSAKYMSDLDFVPQDGDDGFTLAMALNLDAEGLVDIRAIVPTFGNATLPAQMMVAQKIVWDLKARADLPIKPGALGPASQTLQPAPQWYDSTTVPIAASFATACSNAGVALMLEQLLASAEPVTIIAIGPLTDTACLLMNYPNVKNKIAQIVVLASQIEGQSLKVNGKPVNDFNFRMDPVGGVLLLDASGDIPVRLMAFSLTGQTSQSGAMHISFDPTTLKGPETPTPASRKSLDWLLESIKPRNKYWSGIFGASEGPFDQYTLAAVVWPELFKCQPAKAYVQQCPYPAWSPEFAGDGAIPYNAPDNLCVDHNPTASSQSAVPAQLMVSLDLADKGALVRGRFGIDGNLPPLKGKLSQPVQVCTDFIDYGAFETFKKLIYKYTW